MHGTKWPLCANVPLNPYSFLQTKALVRDSEESLSSKGE